MLDRCLALESKEFQRADNEVRASSCRLDRKRGISQTFCAMLYHESRINTAMGLERLVDKAYQALLGVVHTTAVSKRVLIRPPFTFLHKLLVETLAEYSIFTYQQLSFAELVSKEDKVR